MEEVDLDTDREPVQVETMQNRLPELVKSAENVYGDNSYKNHRKAESLPALEEDEEKKHGSVEERNEIVASLTESSKYLNHPPPVIFRHSSAEGIVIDDQRSPGSGASDHGHSRIDEAHTRPVSAQSGYSTDEPSHLKAITLTWENISVRIGAPSRYVKIKQFFNQCFRRRETSYKKMESEKAPILRDVNGVASSGRLLAIMGASGSGKTTLLNVLTYRNIGRLDIDGDVRVNGEVVGSRMRNLAAYVQQDDLFIATLKVREHLMFQAKLRMGKNLKQAQREERVNKVIEDLGLTDCQNTVIGGSRSMKKGLSGGERKRLAFASEVLTNPSMLFCDEPTSGLDSFMALQTVEVLKKMARRGKTIVCTIHQPSSQVFELFDDLCLLSAGRVAYLGPAKEAKQFFDALGHPCPPNFNPADHYIKTLAITPGNEADCKRTIREICKSYDKSAQNEVVRRISANALRQTSKEKLDVQEAVKKTSKYKSTWCQQFNAILWRSWIGNLRERLLVRVRFMQTVVIAIILGLVYYDNKLEGNAGVQNVTGLLFLFVTNMTFQYFFAVVNVFCEELPVFLREHFSGIYRVDAYYLAKIVAELPQYILFPFLFTVILYFMAGLEPNAAVFFTLCGINILTANVAVSLGYMISCLFANLSIALSVAPAFVIPFMLFGGYYINLDSIPVYFVWLQYLSYFKYAFEALVINQFRHVDNIPGCGGDNNCPSDGAGVLKMLSISPDQFIPDLIILAAMIVVIRLVGYTALLIRTRTRKD